MSAPGPDPAPGRLLVLCLKCARKYEAHYASDEPPAFRWYAPDNTVSIITTQECPPCREIPSAALKSMLRAASSILAASGAPPEGD